MFYYISGRLGDHMKKVQSVMQGCLVVFVVAVMSFDATAKTIHKKEGQYLDMDGILTTFSLNKAVGIARRVRVGQFQLPCVFPAV